MKKINIIITFATILVISGCATYHPQYRNNGKAVSASLQNKEIDRSFFMVGNSQFSSKNSNNKVLEAMRQLASERQNEEAFALFLGNTLDASEITKEAVENPEAAASPLQPQLNFMRNFNGTVYVVPGTAEWNKGVDGLELVEDILKETLAQEDVLEPNNGCPLQSLEIGETLQLILIDTQWYLEDWDDNTEMNDKCAVKSRAKFLIELEGELKKSKDRLIIVAMQHPVMTNGKRGGEYPFINQLLPVPGLATLLTQVRSQGAISKQDRYNERYNELMRRVNVLAKDHNRLVFLSGHDRSLQYLEDSNTKQIVVGGVGKPTAAKLGQHGEFSYGGEGFAVLDIYKDQTAGVTFYGVGNTGEATVLFQKQIIDPERTYDLSKLPNTFPQTMKATVYEKELVERSGFFKTVWGDHYREVYGTPVTVPVVDLDTLYGGLTVERAGGGHQTRSLRLKDKEGHDYNMRALKKSAVQFLQTVIVKDKEVEEGFEDTLPEDLILDFYTAAHPFGAFTIPKLSDAANLFHTNPKLYWVPKQKALGKFNEDYGDELYMIVERPDEEYDGQIFNFAEDIISSDDVLEKIREDEKNVIDQQTYIRARIFDMLIGDWDRHNDQWRWAEFSKDGKNVFVPIPRDRDQVYANFDGGLLDAVRTLFSTARQFQVYGEELEHTKWFNTAGIKMDRALLEDYGRDEWIAQATFIKENVTDAVIDEAFKDMPVEAQDETAADIKKKLKGRRDNIVSIAEEYFDYFAKLQTVTGTDKDDYFEITRLPEGKTHIKVYRIKDGEKADKMVDRVYDAAETNQIWVYGLDDDDVFEVKGEGDRHIFIRIIGGQNNDVYRIANGRGLKIYDHKNQKSTVEENGWATFRLTDNYDYNTYVYTKQVQTTNLLLPSLGFNPDDGIRLGATNTFTVQGFQQNPFAQQHRLSAGFFFATSSFQINYEGEFANIWDDWNFLVGGHFRNPNFAENFFGFGNETINPEEEFPDQFDRDYNRVRVGSFGAHIGIVKDGDYGSMFKLTAGLAGIEVEDTPNRFISLARPLELDERKFFATLEGTYRYESYDNRVNPTRGMLFELVSGATKNIDEVTIDGLFGYLKPKWTLFNALTQNRKWVLKTNLQGQVNIGNSFEFYQAAQLGDETGLRGYRTERFTGRSAAAGGADLRYSFNQFRTGLTPVQLGVFAGYDIGRVWVSNDTSDIWHDAYGGGFWINAADLISGTFNLFTSDEGLRLSFAVALSM
jgi:hypothetical protein